MNEHPHEHEHHHEDDRRWPKALALGAALVTLGGAALEVDPALQHPVAIASLLTIAILVVGWRRL